MDLAKGIFNMLHIQDSELAQLENAHQSSRGFQYLAEQSISRINGLLAKT